MVVKTINPVYVNYKKFANTDQYWALDGTSDAGQVTAFQQWYNSKGYTPSLLVDGIYGPLTTAAFKAHGSDWKPAVNQAAPSQGSTTSAPSPSTPGQDQPSGHGIVDKFKALDKTTKILLAVGVAVVLIAGGKLLLKHKTAAKAA